MSTRAWRWEKILDGLSEPETQKAIKLARPQTVNEALTQALKFEAVRQSVRGHARVRAVTGLGDQARTEEDAAEGRKVLLERRFMKENLELISNFSLVVF